MNTIPEPWLTNIKKRHGGTLFNHPFHSNPEVSDQIFNECRRGVGKLIEALPDIILVSLMEALRRGRVNSWTSEKDMVATLARNLGQDRKSVIERFRISDNSDCEYWFKQIDFLRPGKCLFTRHTIRWIKATLKKRRQATT